MRDALQTWLQARRGDDATITELRRIATGISRAMWFVAMGDGDRYVARVEQGGERREHGVLAPVGDEDLARVAPEAGVAQRLRGDRLLQLREAAGGRVPVVLDVEAGGGRGLDDVGGGREVGLTGAEADDVLAGRLERLRLGVDGQGGGRGDGGQTLGGAVHVREGYPAPHPRSR